MRRSRFGLKLVEGLVVLAILGLLLAILSPLGRRCAREPARRNQCRNNMKQIGFALHTYHEVHGSFPPAYTVDEEGNRLHSWRTLILPYLEEQALYESIDLKKPWNDPVNAQARETIVPAYTCPSATCEEDLTTYQAVVGEGFVFNGAKPTRIEDIKDPLGKTLMFIDSSSQDAVPWMSPEDTNEATLLTYDGETRGLHHVQVFLGGFADGHAAAISVDSLLDDRRAMLTVAGGEKIDAGL